LTRPDLAEPEGDPVHARAKVGGTGTNARSREIEEDGDPGEE
jgi:hypothetical protein